MWHTAERRFVRHVCLRNPFPPFLFGIPSIHSLREAWGSWERQHTLPALHYACFMLAKDPIPLSNIPDLCHMQKSIGLVTELWPPRFVTMQWLCSQLCYVTAANQRTVVGIELLASVVWKRGCQPFSCRCSQNVTRCRKEICSTCLFEESIPATPFGNFNHPPPARSRFLRAAARSTTSALWLHHAHPFVAAAGKYLSHAEKQRVWSRSYGLQDLYRFVTMQWLCSQLCYVTAANQWTVVEIERLATIGWKWGCQPFSCRCSQNVTHCRKEICSTCLFKESIPATPFGNFNHPPPARSRFLRAAARSTASALWLHHAHPFVAAAGKNLSHAEKQRVWSRSYGLQDLLQCSDAMWLLQTNEQLSRLSF